MDLITYLYTTVASTVSMLLLTISFSMYWLPKELDIKSMKFKFDGYTIIDVLFQLALVAMTIIGAIIMANGHGIISMLSLTTAAIICFVAIQYIRENHIKCLMDEAREKIELEMTQEAQSDEKWSEISRALTSISEKITDAECRAKSLKLIELLPHMRNCEKQFTNVKWKVLFSSVERLCAMEERWDSAYVFSPDGDLEKAYLKTLEITADRIIAAVEAAERSTREQDHAFLKAIQVQQSIHA